MMSQCASFTTRIVQSLALCGDDIARVLRIAASAVTAVGDVSHGIGRRAYELSRLCEYFALVDN